MNIIIDIDVNTKTAELSVRHIGLTPRKDFAAIEKAVVKEIKEFFKRMKENKYYGC